MVISQYRGDIIYLLKFCESFLALLRALVTMDLIGRSMIPIRKKMVETGI